MEYKKALLSAASILALTAAVGSSADAATAREPSQEATTSARVAEVGSDLYSDPLFELLARTNGSMSPEVLETVITEMFSHPTPAKVAGFPEFLNSIATLGASQVAIERAKDTLLGILGTADINDEIRGALAARLASGSRPIVVVQAQNRRRDPNSTERLGGERGPGTTGQVGPGGGGYN